MKLSVVVPVYNEEDNIGRFVSELAPVLSSISARWELIFAMDPCSDGTEQAIADERKREGRIKLIKLSRRFGQPMATLAGLEYATGDAVVVMDVDLQDPPSLVPKMVEKWREGFEVVCARRTSRKDETWAKRLVSFVGYRVIRSIARVEIPPDTGDFRLMSRRVVQELLRLKEVHGFLRGMVAFVGFRQTFVEFGRPGRHAGQGKYNRFVGSLRIGFNGILCFSNELLLLSGFVGAVIFLGVMGAVAGHFAFGWAPALFRWDGNAPVLLLTSLAAVQLLGLGLLGAYVGRIYDEVKGRPRYVVDEVVGFAESARETGS